MLSDDPNNVRAFQALAEIVSRRAAGTDPDADPLTAPGSSVERQRAGDLAVWSLAEELAGHPRAWHPLVELARLSVHDDHEGTLRRLATAAERDPTGEALAGGLAVLRAAGKPADALGLGIGHWRPREQTPEVGRHLVLAALEAERPLEAKQHLKALDLYPDQAAIAPLRAELARLVTTAEQQIAGT